MYLLKKLYTSALIRKNPFPEMLSGHKITTMETSRYNSIPAGAVPLQGSVSEAVLCLLEKRNQPASSVKDTPATNENFLLDLQAENRNRIQREQPSDHGIP